MPQPSVLAKRELGLYAIKAGVSLAIGRKLFVIIGQAAIEPLSAKEPDIQAGLGIAKMRGAADEVGGIKLKRWRLLFRNSLHVAL